LVKIGLTRDKSDTYEQKLSRESFEAIRDELLPLATSGEPFEAGHVIERASPPSYLVYLLLGLLQETEDLVSPSRGSYRFPEPLDRDGFDALWNNVPEEEVER
jgi:hypothetical protein